MEEKYLQVEKTTLFYIEKNTHQPNCIFFLHGNSSSSKVWRNQLSDVVFTDYHLIAFDLPSHGKSDPAEVDDVSLLGLAKLLTKAITLIANQKPFIIVGLSLATNIIAEMLIYDIKPSGITLAGSCIMGGDYPIEKLGKPNTHVGVVFADDPSKEDVDAYANEVLFSRQKEDIEQFKNDFWSVATPFRSLLAKGIFKQAMSDQIQLLQNRNIPLLIIFGKEEQIINPDYLDGSPLPLWRETIFKIDAAGHFLNLDQPALFNKLLLSFAKDLFK